MDDKKQELWEAIIGQLTGVPNLLGVDLSLATAVRDAYVQAALAAYEDAAMSGLCHEGAWECAVDAMRSLNVNQLVTALQKERHDA